MIKSLPPLHEVAKMAGVQLPQYLGEMQTETERPAADLKH
jgi:flotillin